MTIRNGKQAYRYWGAMDDSFRLEGPRRRRDVGEWLGWALISMTLATGVLLLIALLLGSVWLVIWLVDQLARR